MNIHPTHTCFDDALDLLCEIIKANPEVAQSNELLLVHGICVSPAGDDYAHAWLELEGKCVLFVGILNGERQPLSAKVEEYYAELNVKETTKYTPKEAWEENQKHVNFGPWIEKYKVLCGRKELNRK